MLNTIASIFPRHATYTRNSANAGATSLPRRKTLPLAISSASYLDLFAARVKTISRIVYTPVEPAAQYKQY